MSCVEDGVYVCHSCHKLRIGKPHYTLRRFTGEVHAFCSKKCEEDFFAMKEEAARRTC